MDSTEDQLAVMLREFKSRRKAKVIVESGLYVLIVFFLFVGNFLTLLVMLLDRRMRTIANMFVASLAVSDLLLGGFLAAALLIPPLVTSHWPFNDCHCIVFRFDSHIGLDGSEQILQNRQTSKVPPLLHKEENRYHDTCDMVLFYLRSTNLHATWEQNGLSSFKVLTLCSNQKQCIYGLWYSALRRDSNLCYNLLLL